MRELYVVDRRKPENQIYRVGELIPATGIYEVTHDLHRACHDLTLRLGEKFPPCSRCGEHVYFKLQQAAPEIEADRNFKISLYELPHPEDGDELKTA